MNSKVSTDFLFSSHDVAFPRNTTKSPEKGCTSGYTFNFNKDHEHHTISQFSFLSLYSCLLLGTAVGESFARRQPRTDPKYRFRAFEREKGGECWKAVGILQKIVRPNWALRGNSPMKPKTFSYLILPICPLSADVKQLLVTRLCNR